MWVAFSAMHSARWSGKRKFISAGASVPGVSWKTIRTPSTVSSWPVWVMSTVGGIRVTVPVEVRRAQAGADLTGRALGQGGAVHVGRPAGHRGARVHVLGDGVLEEARRGEDRHAARRRRLAGDHAPDTAEVVDVAVGVDHAR